MALSGPRIPPLKGQATHLVVLVHGYGADGNDLIGLAPHWQRALPTVAFAAPNGPERCPGSPGYQWFPIARLDPQELARGVESAAPKLEDFIRAELARLSLDESRLALIGFSQGTMLSLALAMSGAVKPACVIGYSGLLAQPARPSPPPPVLLVHGAADPMIPAEAMFATAATLGEAGVPVQWHLSPGTGHGIDETGLALGGQFLTLALRGRLALRGEVSCPIPV